MEKAILFDLDGVVVDTENTVWLDSSIRLLELYQKKHDEEYVRPRILGTKFEVGTKIMHEYYAIPESFEGFLEKRRQLVLRGFAEKVEFMDGFKEFYIRIGERKKAVATSMDTEFLALTLNHLPLESLFGKHIYPIAKAGARGKPHPDIFLYAAKMIDQNPADCVVIEDSPHGITAANSANMRSIGITTSVSREQLQHAHYVVDSFAGITAEMIE